MVCWLAAASLDSALHAMRTVARERHVATQGDRGGVSVFQPLPYPRLVPAEMVMTPRTAARRGRQGVWSCCLRRKPVVYDFHELPSHLTENRWVLSHHRAEYSLVECVRSVVFLHSETLNIWTHLLGGLLFLYVAHQLYDGQYAGTVTLQALLTGLGFLVSAAAHTFTPYSESLYRLLFKMDRVGIAVFIGGALVASMHQCFRCDPVMQTTFVSLSTAVAFLAAVLNFGPSTNPRKRVLYAITYSIEVFSSGFPVLVEWNRSKSFPEAYDEFAHKSVHSMVVGTGFTYLLGGLASFFYATNFPERIRPGTFDFLPGHSLMHIFALLATLKFQEVTALWSGLSRDEHMSCGALGA